MRNVMARGADEGTGINARKIADGRWVNAMVWAISQQS